MANSFNRNDPLFPLKEAVDFLPKRGGKKTHYSTLYRWATKGARGRVLESTMVGGIRYTSLRAIERFIATPNLVSAKDVDEIFDVIDEALNDAGI